MTAYELTDAVNSTMGIYLSAFLAYLSIISAYLVTAFMAGSKLTNQQVIVVSVLFVFGAGLVVMAMWGGASRIVYLSDALRRIDPNNPILFTSAYRNSLTIVSVLGIFAAFKFMLDIRHSDSE